MGTTIHAAALRHGAGTPRSASCESPLVGRRFNRASDPAQRRVETTAGACSDDYVGLDGFSFVRFPCRCSCVLCLFGCAHHWRRRLMQKWRIRWNPPNAPSRKTSGKPPNSRAFPTRLTGLEPATSGVTGRRSEPIELQPRSTSQSPRRSGYPRRTAKRISFPPSCQAAKPPESCRQLSFQGCLFPRVSSAAIAAPLSHATPALAPLRLQHHLGVIAAPALADSRRTEYQISVSGAACANV